MNVLYEYNCKGTQDAPVDHYFSLVLFQLMQFKCLVPGILKQCRSAYYNCQYFITFYKLCNTD